MRSRVSCSCLALLAILMVSARAEALTLEYDPPAYFVSGSETVLVFATLTNDSHAVSLTGFVTSLTLIVLRDLPYHAAFAFFDDSVFDGLELAPGASFSFVFATLTPKRSAAPPGLYEAGLLHWSFDLDQGLTSVEVGGLFSVTVLPAPPALILLTFVACIGRLTRVFS